MPITDPTTHEEFTVTVIARMTLTVGTADGIMGAMEAGEIACGELLPVMVNPADLRWEVERVTPGEGRVPAVENFVEVIDDGND